MHLSRLGRALIALSLMAQNARTAATTQSRCPGRILQTLDNVKEKEYQKNESGDGPEGEADAGSVDLEHVEA